MIRRTLVLLTAALVAYSSVAAPPPQFLNSGRQPASLPFSEAVRVGNLLFLSGQLGVKPGTLELVPGGLPAEAAQMMENIKATLASAGLGMDDVVKCTVMLADMKEWPAFNEVYRRYFPRHFPARSAFGATGLALGARVEMECIAAASTPD
jgi:2-iminobutanoate/2-iminopropanoate deaminase